MVACYFCLDDFYVIVRAEEKEPQTLFPQHLRDLIYAHDPVCCMDDRLETMDWNISSSAGAGQTCRRCLTMFGMQSKILGGGTMIRLLSKICADKSQ